MNKAYLLIGGNVGNRAQNLATARQMIGESCGKLLRASSLYETAAWGKTDQPSFFNQVLVIGTKLQPGELMQRLLELERQMGRSRSERYGPRTIDMDILLFEDRIINTPLLTVPHPALPERRFALLPLCEVAPSLVHPILQKNIKELLAQCPDALEVKSIE